MLHTSWQSSKTLTALCPIIPRTDLRVEIRIWAEQIPQRAAPDLYTHHTLNPRQTQTQRNTPYYKHHPPNPLERFVAHTWVPHRQLSRRSIHRPRSEFLIIRDSRRGTRGGGVRVEAEVDQNRYISALLISSWLTTR